MTNTRKPLDVVLAERAAGAKERQRQPGAFWIALGRALATPPDSNYEAFRQMNADTLRQQEKR